MKASAQCKMTLISICAGWSASLGMQIAYYFWCGAAETWLFPKDVCTDSRMHLGSDCMSHAHVSSIAQGMMQHASFIECWQTLARITGNYRYPYVDMTSCCVLQWFYHHYCDTQHFSMFLWNGNSSDVQIIHIHLVYSGLCLDHF